MVGLCAFQEILQVEQRLVPHHRFLYTPLTSTKHPYLSARCTSLTWLLSARTRLSADGKSSATGGTRQFNGLIDVYKKTLKSDGIRGLYRGFVPNLLGICVYRGL